MIEHGKDHLFFKIKHVHHFLGVETNVERLVCAKLFQFFEFDPLLLAFARVVFFEVAFVFKLLDNGRL